MLKVQTMEINFVLSLSLNVSTVSKSQLQWVREGREWELKLQLDSFDGLWGLAPACCQNRFPVRFVVCAFQMESIILLCVICDLCESLRFESQHRRVLPQLKRVREG